MNLCFCVLPQRQRAEEIPPRLWAQFVGRMLIRLLDMRREAMLLGASAWICRGSRYGNRRPKTIRIRTTNRQSSLRRIFKPIFCGGWAGRKTDVCGAMGHGSTTNTAYCGCYERTRCNRTFEDFSRSAEADRKPIGSGIGVGATECPTKLKLRQLRRILGRQPTRCPPTSHPPQEWGLGAGGVYLILTTGGDA